MITGKNVTSAEGKYPLSSIATARGTYEYQVIQIKKPEEVFNNHDPKPICSWYTQTQHFCSDCCKLVHLFTAFRPAEAVDKRALLFLLLFILRAVWFCQQYILEAMKANQSIDNFGRQLFVQTFLPCSYADEEF